MSATNSTTLEKLDNFNQNTFHYRIPALVFTGLTLPIGIVGNAAVIYIYGFRLKQSNLHLFVTMLAVSDLISCLICIPMEMYQVLVYYDYTSIASCKFAGFLTFACYIFSALMLLTISVERYLKVCRSTARQMSRKTVHILIGAVFFVSSLLAVPVPMFALLETYTLDDATIVQICTHSIRLGIYDIVLFAFVLCILVAMSVLYWRVVKTTRSQIMWSQQRREQFNFHAINDKTQLSMSVADTKMLRQTNWTVVSISAVYVASCIPVFVIVMVALLMKPKPGNNFDFFFFFLTQSWTLNCTLNPVVYGFLNNKFRAEFRSILNSFSLEKSKKANQSSSTATL